VLIEGHKAINLVTGTNGC